MRQVQELSSGGIVYRKRRGQIEIALIRVGKRWALPKGHVEEGEEIEQAACREVFEETGLQGKLMAKLGEITYWYTNKRRQAEPVRIFKRVHFYLLRWSKGEIYGHDHEVDEARWFSAEEALRKLSFSTERKMVRRAMNIVAGGRSKSRVNGGQPPNPE